jgi:hypothetical protein
MSVSHKPTYEELLAFAKTAHLPHADSRACAVLGEHLTELQIRDDKHAISICVYPPRPPIHTLEYQCLRCRQRIGEPLGRGTWDKMYEIKCDILNGGDGKQVIEAQKKKEEDKWRVQSDAQREYNRKFHEENPEHIAKVLSPEDHRAFLNYIYPS